MIVEPRADQVVWLDGEYVSSSSATMQVWDNHYGVGVFEGVRAYESPDGASIFRLHDHTERLFCSARMINIALPAKFDAATLDDVQVELLRRNRLRSAYIRPFVFHAGILGLAPRVQGLRVRVAVMAVEWTSQRSAEASAAGIALRTSSFVRAGGPFKAKANANYLAGILAHQEAVSMGADDALVTDASGFIAETSGANIFVVKNGALATPPTDAILAGITRDTVMALAQGAGLCVEEKRLTREDVFAADEAFLTGTATEVTHVQKLDGRSIGSGRLGPVTRALQTAYGDLVRGRSDVRRDWLTSVRF
jgi:branched-chain amino acid aminotransferase